MSRENEELKDLLKQASSNAVSKMTENSISTKIIREEEIPAETIKKEEDIQKAIAIVEEGKDKWQVIAERMDGDFAERFTKEMENMNGKEFVRTYMKMLEYFKPKMHRAETGETEKEDNVIRIEIHRAPKDNTEIIDITEN